MKPAPEIAVVIPCYRVRSQILPVIAGIGPEVGQIIVVDDACPEATGDYVSAHCADRRVTVLRHPANRGVGGAMATGYRHALAGPADVVVKLDGDGQMDPGDILRLAGPLLSGQADYAKGNRFYRVGFTRGMPWVRLVGNAALSFLSKLSSGYWQVADPTNGFTAIRSEVLAEIEIDRLDARYFFESDLLYHLGQARAVVVDVPMRASYGDEPSSLVPSRMVVPFLAGHLRNTFRRIGYGYFLRGFSLASVELVLGAALWAGGTAFGAWHWHQSYTTGVVASAGTVMLAALPIILGFQMLLSWLNFDVSAEPRQVIHGMLRVRQESRQQPAKNGATE